MLGWNEADLTRWGTGAIGRAWTLLVREASGCRASTGLLLVFTGLISAGSYTESGHLTRLPRIFHVLLL